MRHSKHILTIQCLSTSNIRFYLFLAHCQAKALFMRAYHANGFFSNTHAMTTHAMFAPYKSRVVSRGGLLLPLTYLPGTSVEKKITRPACGLSTDPVNQCRRPTYARVLRLTPGELFIGPTLGPNRTTSGIDTICHVASKVASTCLQNTTTKCY